VPVGGGAAVTLVSGRTNPAQIAADSRGSVYWGDYAAPSSVLVKCATTGCGGIPTTLVTGQESVEFAAVNAAGQFWVANDGSNGTSAVVGCRTVGGCGGAPSTLLAQTGDYDYGLTASPSTVYWAANLGSFTMSAILACPTSGCTGGTATTLASSQQGPGPMTLDPAETTLYWTDYGSIQKCAASGCGGVPTTLAAGGAEESSPGGIAVDATNIYWTNGALVLACGINGCGNAPVTLASGQNTPGAIVVSATAVYWLDTGTAGMADGAVMMLAK
jgi:hypothetical protein